eukprot:886566-Prorocentrum_minimum.AAC.2
MNSGPGCSSRQSTSDTSRLDVCWFEFLEPESRVTEYHVKLIQRQGAQPSPCLSQNLARTGRVHSLRIPEFRSDRKSCSGQLWRSLWYCTRFSESARGFFVIRFLIGFRGPHAS